MRSRRREKSAGEDPPRNDQRSDYSRALDRLTAYLALRDHSRFELRTKLLRRFPPELVERLMDEAERNGWLTAEETISERLVLALERRMKSRRYIEGQLRKKKLPVPPRETVSYGEESGESERVRALVERKFGPLPLTFEAKAKAYRFLKYRGFDDRAIKQVLNAKP